MRTLKHPLSGALYDLHADGTIRYRARAARGLFDREGSVASRATCGRRIPHLCVWVAGDKLANRFVAAADALANEHWPRTTSD